LVNPFAAVTDLARSFDLDEDERGEISLLLERAVRLRDKAGRLVGQWQDPIETTLQQETGLLSAGGGPERNGVPGRLLHLLDPQDFAAHEALATASRSWTPRNGTPRWRRWRGSWACRRSD
jgi:hypothetical protein